MDLDNILGADRAPNCFLDFQREDFFPLAGIPRYMARQLLRSYRTDDAFYKFQYAVDSVVGTAITATANGVYIAAGALAMSATTFS